MPRLRLAVALVVAVLSAAPVLLAWWTDADWSFLANESIAYRFFWAERLSLRESPAPYQFQGHSMGVIHRLVYETLPGPESDIRTRFSLFGIRSSLAALVIVAPLFIAAAWQRMAWTQLGLLAVVTLLPIYGAQRAGWEYRVWPDYYALDQAFYPLVVLLAWRPASAAWLGALIAIVAANKISLLPFACLPMVAWYTAYVESGAIRKDRPRPREKPGAALMSWAGFLISPLPNAGLSAARTFVAIYLILYGGRGDQALRALRLWLEVLIGDSYGEATFWARLPEYLSGRTYGWLIAGALVGIAVGGWGMIFRSWPARDNVEKARKREPQASTCTSRVVAARLAPDQQAGVRFLGGVPLFLCILAVAVLALAFVVRRPAQTSLDESSFVLVALAAITLGYRPRPVLVWPFVAGAALLCLLTFPAAEMVTTIRTSAASGEPRWQLHAHLMTYRQPVIVVIRDNSQALLSIEEMLLKGFSNQPTWYIGKGQDLLNRRSEWLSFRTANSAPGPGIDAPYPDTAVIAVFVRSSPSVIEEYPSLGEAVSRRRCQEWGFGAGNVVLICEPRS